MHCDARALSLVSLVFGEFFFGGSPSLHDLFLHFLAKCFFCNFIALRTIIQLVHSSIGYVGSHLHKIKMTSHSLCLAIVNI